jgi:dTDP-glucose 4,6-dehydratase
MIKNKNFSTFVLDEDLEFLSNYSNIIWKKLNNKKIFITGGSGFFGRNFISALYFIEKLFNYNFSITCLTRNKKKFLEKSNYYSSKKITR